MRPKVYAFLILAVISPWVGATGQAADAPTKGEKEWIPLPPQMIPQPSVTIVPMGPRPGTREVWQYYGVDRSGRFRPRVVLSPSGAYYLQTGEPFLWPSNRSTSFMPYVLD